MEKDDEIKEDGMSYTTPFRAYDPGLGRLRGGRLSRESQFTITSGIQITSV